MAAFDITTNPPNQKIEAGSSGRITVVVSNRLGKPVMARVDAVLAPPAAAGWLMSPAEPQRKFEADPAATITFEFTVAVPPGTAATALQFRATVVDVLASDDNRAEGQMVSLDVSPKAVVDTGGGGGVPWWVWVIAAVVLIGAGFGIYKLVSPKGVPSVIGKSAAEATRILTAAGYSPVTVKDTIDSEAKDTTVVNQVPAARDKLPVDSLKGKTPAVIVVNREATVVPAIVNLPLALAIERLREAGLRVGKNGGKYTPNVAQDEQIADVAPAPGDTVPKGFAVDILIFSYSDRPPCANPRLCLVESRAEWRQKVRDMGRRQP